MHRTQLFLPEELHAQLKAEAQARQTSVSDLVRTIIVKHLHTDSRQQTEQGTVLLLEMAVGGSDE